MLPGVVSHRATLAIILIVSLRPDFKLSLALCIKLK